MAYVDTAALTVFDGSGDSTAPVVYVIDAVEHPFDIDGLASGRGFTVVKVPLRDWNDSLTPWPAAGLYRGETDFGGNAGATLAELLDEIVPSIEQAAGLVPEKRAICGYSLGGLFALYAFTHSGAFQACACVSGSVWYEGWVEHLRALPFEGEGRFAYLSIGSKEKHAAPKILHHVQDNMEECAAILCERGCQVEFSVGPGGHMSLVKERFAAAFSALDGYLT